MCLEKLSKGPPPKDGRYWKVFQVRKGKLYTHIQGNNHQEIPRGKWVNERFFRYHENNIISDVGMPAYYTGWHGFGSELNAKIWKNHIRDDLIVLRVKYRKAVAHGKQYINGALKPGGKNYNKNARVIVAKEIFIPKD